MFLHVLGHVEADEGVFGAEHLLRQALRQVGLAHAGRAEKEERADGAVRVLQPESRTLNSLGDEFHGLVLPDDAVLEGVPHSAQTGILLRLHTLDGHAGHERHDACHVVHRDSDRVVPQLFLPLADALVELFLQCLLFVAERQRLLEILLFGSLIFLLADSLDLGLHLGDKRGLLAHLSLCSGAHLVHGVNGFVGETAVGDIAVGEVHARPQHLVAVGHVVVCAVFLRQFLQDEERLLLGRRLNGHLLEPALEGAVFLDGLAVLVDGRSTNALHFAARQRRFEDVGRIQRTRGVACADDDVYLVDEEDDFGVLLQLVDD